MNQADPVGGLVPLHVPHMRGDEPQTTHNNPHARKGGDASRPGGVFMRAQNDDFITKFWAKTDRSSPSWHPVAYHNLDVAASGCILLETRPALLEKLSRLTGVEPQNLKNWIVFLLALHDCGKFSDGFQRLCPELMQRLQGRCSAAAYNPSRSKGP